MAKAKTKTVSMEKENIVVNNETHVSEVDILKKENEDLNNKINRLEDLINEMLKKTETNNNVTTIIEPSTYVAPGLDTTIYVNNAPITFARFGERRTFRFSDMQSIVSQYRDWFARGILTLGDDCSDFADDFGIAVTKMPVSQDTHKKLASLSNEEFEDIIKNMNSNHRILIAKTWIQRCENKVAGYDNVEKIKILNKYTEGFMSKFLKDLFSSEV